MTATFDIPTQAKAPAHAVALGMAAACGRRGTWTGVDSDPMTLAVRWKR